MSAGGAILAGRSATGAVVEGRATTTSSATFRHNSSGYAAISAELKFHFLVSSCSIPQAHAPRFRSPAMSVLHLCQAVRGPLWAHLGISTAMTLDEGLELPEVGARDS